MPEATEATAAEATETTANESTETNLAAEKEQETANETGDDELPEFETLGDGRVAIDVGGSRYFGKTKSEAWAAMKKGIEEKDKSYAERARELNELKAKKHIRDSDDNEGDDVDIKAPDRPNETTILKETFTASGLKPEMAYWKAAQWRMYKETNNLDELDIDEAKETVRNAINETNRRWDQALKQYESDSVVWINRSKLHEDITPRVQEIVADAGLDPEEFGAIYLKLLRDKDYHNSDGLLNGEKIITAIHKEVVKRLKVEKQSTLEKTAEQLKKELEEKKRVLGKGGRSDGNPETKKKTPGTIEEASKMALKLLR